MHLTELKQSDWVISAWIINEFEKNHSYDIKTVHFLEWPLGDIHSLAREICYKLGVSNYLYQFVGTLYCIYRCWVEISVRAFFVMCLYIYGFYAHLKLVYACAISKSPNAGSIKYKMLPIAFTRSQKRIFASDLYIKHLSSQNPFSSWMFYLLNLACPQNKTENIQHLYLY